MQIKISDKTYDALNNTVKLVLPAIGTLYFSLAGIWNLPYGEQVVGSFAAMATFLGVAVTMLKRGWSSSMDGSLVVDKSNPKKDIYSLEVNTPFEELANKKTVTLKVNTGL